MSDKQELTPLQQMVQAELNKDSSSEDLTETTDEQLAGTSKSEVAVTTVEEVSDNVQEEAQEQVIEDASKGEDPYLEEAIQMGYNPNYQGPNRKTPEQFVRDGSFFRKIDEQKKEINELKSLMKQSIDHAKKVEKAAIDNKLLELRALKEQQILEGDLEGVRVTEQKENILKTERDTVQAAKPAEQMSTEGYSENVKEFIKRNDTWCNFNTPENKQMAEDADLNARQLALRHPEKTEREVLEMVEDRIKKLYPHRFENPKIKKPATVGRSTSTKDVATNAWSSKLTPEQKSYVDRANKYGAGLTYESYAKQLKLLGGMSDE